MNSNLLLAAQVRNDQKINMQQVVGDRLNLGLKLREAMDESMHQFPRIWDS